jgi:type VI secretion system protein ImpG
MDALFLGYYERELKHVRELGGEFAQRFPKIAGRLGLDAFGCADPYVERLIEAFAFLTARIQLKLASSHGEFTEQMLQLLHPNFAAPLPSMAVMQYLPNRREGALASGVTVPRGSALRSKLALDQQTACEYRTAHPVRLWPISIVSADYRANPGELVDMERLAMPESKAALRIVLQAERGARFDRLPIETLPLYLRGGDVAARLYEAVLGTNIGMVVQPTTRPREFMHVRRRRSIVDLGLEDELALLPRSNTGFEGYRLLQELFAFPERYCFAELTGLREVLQGAATEQIEIVLLFDRADARLDGVVHASHLALFCTPAINLFPRVCDRVPLNTNEYEHPVVVDRLRPLDFEIHSLTRVVGYGQRGEELADFTPLYAPSWVSGATLQPRGYTIRRRPEPLGPGVFERDQDPHAPYVPTQTFLSLVDGEHGAGRTELRQLSVHALCTHRALPLWLSRRGEHVHFEDQSGAPVESVRCLAGPTPPRSSPAFGDLSWRLLSHLSTDFLTLIRRDGAGAGALREVLRLYASQTSREQRAQIDGVVGLDTRSVVRPLPFPGPIAFGRGIEVTLTCDERAFSGGSTVLLGSVLARFFAKYASLNSFTETVLRTQQRGEVMRWPIAAGQRPTL